MLKWILYFILCTSIYAQHIQDVFVTEKPVLTIESKDLGSFSRSGVDGSDSLALSVNTRRLYLDSAWTKYGIITVIYDSLLVYGGDLNLYFSYNKDTTGVIKDTLYVAHSGVGSPASGAITYSITTDYDLLVSTGIDFGTVNTSTTRSLTLENQTGLDITDITYSGLGIASPFSTSNTVTSVSAGSSSDINVIFNTSVEGSYTDTLIVTSSAGTDNVILTGTYDALETGSSWFYAGIGGGGWVSDIEIDPDSNYIYAGTDLSGFFWSDDFGDNWTASNSDSGGYQVADIAVNPDSSGIVYVANNAGIWKSSDHGQTLTRLGTGQLYGVQIWDNDLTTYDPALNKTFALDSANFSAVWVNPANTAHIWAGTGTAHGVLGGSQGYPNPCRIAKSEDAGVTWTYMSSANIDLVTNAVSTFSGDPTNEDVVYVGTRRALLKTTNGGTTWTKLDNNAENIFVVTVNPTDPTNVWYAADFFSDDVKWRYSTNSGTSFSNPSESGLPNTSWANNLSWLSFDEFGTLYASTEATGGTSLSYIYKTTSKSGGSWTAMSNAYDWTDWAFGGEIAFRTKASPGGNIVATGKSGVRMTTNAKDVSPTWTDKVTTNVEGDYWRTNGIDITCINDIATSPDGEIVIAGSQDFAGIISHDYGYSWKKLDDLYDDGMRAITCVGIDPYNTNYIYAFATVYGSGDNDYNGNFLYRSTNGGLSFSKVNELWNQNAQPGNMVFLSNGRLFVNTETVADVNESGIYYSDDRGTNWTKITNSRSFYGGRMDYDPVNDVLWICQQSWTSSSSTIQGVAKVTNCTTTPTYVYGTWNANLNNVKAVAVHDDPDSSNVIFALVAGSTTGGKSTGASASACNGVWKSLDGGSTWDRTYSRVNPLNQSKWSDMMIDPSNAARMYITQDKITWFGDISGSEGILMSEDYGISWSSINYDIPIKAIACLDVTDDGRIFVGTYSAGLYRLDNTTIEISAPSMTNLAATQYDGNNVLLTATINKGGDIDDNLTVECYLGKDTTDWGAEKEMMAISGNSATFNYYGLTEGEKYYFKGRIINSVGYDWFYTDSITISSASPDEDSLYIAQGSHDAFFRIGLYMNLSDVTNTYLKVGAETSGANNGDNHIGLIFTGMNDWVTIDSAKLYFKVYSSSYSTATDLQIRGELVEDPSVFTTYVDFQTRLANKSTFNDDITVSDTWTANTWDSLEVTNVIQGMDALYDYGSDDSGLIDIMLIDDENTGDVRRVIRSYEYDSGSSKAYIKIWGTK